MKMPYKIHVLFTTCKYTKKVIFARIIMNVGDKILIVMAAGSGSREADSQENYRDIRLSGAGNTGDYCPSEGTYLFLEGILPVVGFPLPAASCGRWIHPFPFGEERSRKGAGWGCGGHSRWGTSPSLSRIGQEYVLKNVYGKVPGIDSCPSIGRHLEIAG